MISSIQFKFLEEDIKYTGKELRPHFGFEQTGIYGSLITCFNGPCEVPTAHLVDWEDKRNADFIRAGKMIHFIGEFFGTTLETTVFLQRFFMVWAEKILSESGVQNIERRGDDLFVGEKKLSVSIATCSAVSTLVHWGINLDSTGAPVQAVGLLDLGFDEKRARVWATDLLESFIEEVDSIRIAQMKVSPV